MLKESIKVLGIISSLLVIVGLVLMFSSVSFGTFLGDIWLANQVEGIADTSQYMIVLETHKNNFVIAGSILFAVGVITAILTYFIYLFYGIRETTISPDNKN